LQGDLIRLVLWKLVQKSIEEGFSVHQMAILTGSSPSHLYGLKKLFETGGYAAVAPLVAELWPEALAWQLYDRATALRLSGVQA